MQLKVVFKSCMYLVTYLPSGLDSHLFDENASIFLFKYISTLLRYEFCSMKALRTLKLHICDLEIFVANTITVSTLSFLKFLLCFKKTHLIFTSRSRSQLIFDLCICLHLTVVGFVNFEKSFRFQ